MPRLARSASISGMLVLACPILLAAQQPTPADTLRLAEIRVVGHRDALAAIPGSATVVDAVTMERWHALTINEVLRRVPGLFARDEEGFGLRPNIGVRGLNPTRSTKVLLLEDGIPLTFAPYGDNATYYHPPIERFERVEVLKGSGQILFGPQTVGGVINYVTPSVPAQREATLTLTPGSRRYLNGQARAGGTFGRLGVLASYDRKQGDGARANVGSRLDDATLKTTFALGARHALTLRGNWYRERSNVTYSGLTEAEWAADPRQNPFLNDSMRLDRAGASATHRWDLRGATALTTTAYAYGVSRDWWRQSSNSGERPNDASDATCAGMANLSTTCGNQGRLRDFTVIGLEPRVHAATSLLGLVASVDAGARAHFERQERLQVNGDAPTSRSAGDAVNTNSGVREDNVRRNAAYSAFTQVRLAAGRWTVTPGLRVEHIRYHRVNRLVAPEVSGRTELTALIPGLGLTYGPAPQVTLFAGAHRGFAPPRTEDILDNATGGAVDLDAELSWNTELGIRARPALGVSVEATAFRMDFENQIVPASVAGGAGATLTSAGHTLHQGLEVAARLDAVGLGRGAPGVFVQGTWTWLPTARFEGPRFVYVGTGGGDVTGKVYAGQNASGTRTQVSVTGNRLPYAPRQLLTAALGYAYHDGLDLRLEAVYVGRQFGDALNTTVTVADGQQGVLAAYTTWNAAATWSYAPTRTTAFLTIKNLGDALYVADRTRGLLPGAPRTVQAGITQAF